MALDARETHKDNGVIVKTTDMTISYMKKMCGLSLTRDEDNLF